MNILMFLIVVVFIIIGVVSSLFVVASIIGTIAYKIFRKAKFGTSLFN